MTERNITVSTSLEMRQISLLVQTASRFACDIMMSMNEKSVNVKSIMGVFSLGLSAGQEIKLSCEGLDEEKAADELEKFFSI